MSILFSDEYPIVVLAFRVRNRGSTWLDGILTDRIYVEKHDMEQQVQDLIKGGRLTLDRKGEKKPILVSVKGSGGFYVAILEDPEAVDDEVKEKHKGKTLTAQPYMQPFTNYDEERNAIQLIEENRFLDFVELLEAYKPKKEENLVVFDGSSIHPLSTRTLVSEMKVHGREVSSRRDKGLRTVILVDRRVSMAKPWSLWEQYTKIRVARFLANVVMTTHSNVAVYSYGNTLKMEHSLEDVEPSDEETRLDLALRKVSLFEPERLVILTDNKPVYIEGVETDEDCEKAIELLDAFGRSGVQTLIFTLGRNNEMEKFYNQLTHTLDILVVLLKTGGDLIRMMHRIAEWF